jgi:Tol biopolymer transport system component
MADAGAAAFMGLGAGTKLGPYEIVGPLGAGGMGEVYRATDTRLGRDVAIKVLPTTLANDGDRLRRFEQEAKTIATLNHPNILGLHDIGTHESAPFLVSELLEGETLRQKIEAGPIPVRRAVEYALGIAHGLAAAHDRGVVHRDLKPENVFITRDGRVKILDFGLAKLVREEHSLETAMTMTSPTTMPGMVMGTVGYMSPEQVRGEPSDARSDIFSFGTVLYEMLTGKRAFKRDTTVETMTAILREDPPELAETGWQGPIGLQRILSRCLEKDPARRFQSASDLAFAIEALSGTGATHSVAIEAVKASARSPRWIWIAALGLACAGLGAAMAWMLRPGVAPVPTFQRLSFERATLLHGRFAAEGKTVVYSGVMSSGVPDTYMIREDYPTSVPAGLHGAMILAISKQNEMAVLVRPNFVGQYQWRGTLATVPMGGTAPRELLENVYDADWSPDGSAMAVIDRKDGKWRVEYPIGKVLLETNNWITDVRVSPDGNYVAVFRHPPDSLDDRGNLLLLDRAGKQRVISAEWEALQGLAWKPDGKEVWYSAAESGDSYCIRSSNAKGEERAVFCGTGGTRLHDISATGRVLVSSEVRRTTMALVDHGSKEEIILSGVGSAIDPRLTPDGRELVFTDASERGGKDYGVYLRKMDEGSPVRIGGGGYGSDISNDGKFVLVVMPGEGRVQVVPVGAGQGVTLKWDGFQVSSANWFPDGQHILLFGNAAGQAAGLYETDRNGSAPKLLVKSAPEWADVMPDGESLLLLVNGELLQRSIAHGSEKKLRKLEPGEVPMEWASEAGHLFTLKNEPMEIRIDKVDLGSERRETWYEFKPKNQDGALLVSHESGITLDGRWMIFDYWVQLGQFYESENLR